MKLITLSKLHNENSHLHFGAKEVKLSFLKFKLKK